MKALLLHPSPEPAIAPVLADSTMCVALETFRPAAVAPLVERGQWRRLDDPLVRASPSLFAVRLTDLTQGEVRMVDGHWQAA